ISPDCAHRAAFGELLLCAGEPVAVDVTDDGAGAVLEEQPGDGMSDAGRTPGDQGPLPIQLLHGASLGRGLSDRCLRATGSPAARFALPCAIIHGRWRWRRGRLSSQVAVQV